MSTNCRKKSQLGENRKNISGLEEQTCLFTFGTSMEGREPMFILIYINLEENN